MKHKNTKNTKNINVKPISFRYAELPDGKVLSGSEDGNLLLWEGNFIKCVINTPGGGKAHEGNIECIEMLTDEVKPFQKHNEMRK